MDLVDYLKRVFGIAKTVTSVLQSKKNKERNSKQTVYYFNHLLMSFCFYENNPNSA